MQRCLIHHNAGEERVAIFFQQDSQPAEPLAPLLTQVTSDPDLTNHWPVVVILPAGLVRHMMNIHDNPYSALLLFGATIRMTFPFLCPVST